MTSTDIRLAFQCEGLLPCDDVDLAFLQAYNRGLVWHWRTVGTVYPTGQQLVVQRQKWSVQVPRLV